MTEKRPSKLRYIFAWIIVNVLGYLSSSVLAFFYIARLDFNFTDKDLKLITFYELIIVTIVWRLVYGMKPFRSLNITKVFPWMFGLGFVGAVYNVFTNSNNLSSANNLGLDSEFLYFQPFVSWIALIICFYLVCRFTGRLDNNSRMTHQSKGDKANQPKLKPRTTPNITQSIAKIPTQETRSSAEDRSELKSTESKLEELRRLYEKGLVSEGVWIKKQQDLLDL